MYLFCVECGKNTEHTKRTKARSNKYEFIVVGCELCNGLMCKCEHCDYCRSFNGNKVPTRTRKIVGTHVKQCENNQDQINEQQVECGGTVSESTSLFSQSLGVNNLCDDFPETGSCDGCDGDSNQDDSQSYSNDQVILASDFSNSISVPKFVIPATDQYVRMEIDMYHRHNKLLGGFRSACWRSRYRKNLFGQSNIVDMNDAKFMFYVTSLNCQHTESMNDTLYKLLMAI